MDTMLEDMTNNSKEWSKTFSPNEVMRMLNSDSKEIQRLCSEVKIFPKKDNQTGKIFFFKNDVEVLKKIKDLHNKSQKIAKNKQSTTSNLKDEINQCLREKVRIENTIQPKPVEIQVKQKDTEKIKSEINKTAKTAEQQKHTVSNPIAVLKPEISTLTESVSTAIETVNNVQDNIIEKLSSYMDEKLDGLDEIIVDLIKCKVENERLKNKVEQLTKENFTLAGKLSSFTPIALGLYLKKD